MTALENLKDALGEANVLTGQEVRDRIPHVWKPGESIIAKAICLPRSVEEVAQICRICNDARQPLVVQGGLTNLVQSTHSTLHDIVVSMERMNQILEVDVANRSMTVEAGAILESIQQAAVSSDLFFPLNFGARGSCQIGGCISTNAGGLRVVKYGMTRDLVLGVEAVLADGTVLSPMHKIIKNNSGYDTRQWFIGTEGTLGIVTKAVLRLFERPIARYSAFAAHKDFASVIRHLKLIDKHLEGRLSAFEVFWPEAYEALSRPETKQIRPLPTGAAFYTLCESLYGQQEGSAANFQEVMEKSWTAGNCDDMALAFAENDNRALWSIREEVGNLLSLFPARQDFDVSLAVGDMEVYINNVKEGLKNKLGLEQCYVFGHMADGNLHLIVGKPNLDDSLTRAINDIVYGPLASLEGSVSAEHGIGLDKKEFLRISRSAEEIHIMRGIKQVLDPNCILNPGKIFD